MNTDYAMIKPLSNDEKLEVYGLGMQARWGDCNTPQPFVLDFAKYFMWQGWMSKTGMDRADAEE